MLVNRLITSSTTGAAEYTKAGTYSWMAPAGVTSVCAVCIGAGQDGNAADAGSFGYTRAGSSGALSYKNNITVVPFTYYTVFVAAVNSTSPSYFVNTSTVKAGRGSDRTGDGGGNGVSVGTESAVLEGAAGWGAGGYPANAGANGTAGGLASANQGNGGSGGGGSTIYGTGTNGASGGAASGFAGGNGGAYGGGGGGGGGNNSTNVRSAGGAGQGGAVRIIWGAGKSYPSNAT